MAKAKNVEQRLQSALEDPTAGNQTCSECDRVPNKPVWAAFLFCPVDHKRLGVVCCSKCYHLFQKVKDEDCDFTAKSLTELNDWTEQDIDALESSGNRLVNTCYEATVTNEKDGRDRRMYGYEAFFFEKYVNLSHFDDVLYRQMIAQSAKALVEKRFNQSLFAFNLKKQEELEASLTQLSLLGDEHEEEAGHDDEQDFMQRAHHSASSIRDRRKIGMRKRQSSRNVLDRELIPERMRSSRNLLGEKKEDGVKTSKLSSEKLNSLRQELLGGEDNRKRLSAGNDTADGPRRATMGRRQGSNRRISCNEDLHGSFSGMRQSPSRPSLTEQQQQREGGITRSSSRRGLMGQQQQREGGITRSSSRKSLMPKEPEREGGMTEQQLQREGGMKRSSSRKSLMPKELEKEGDVMEQQGQREGGMKRSSSRKSLMPKEPEREGGIKRASSRNKLLVGDNEGGEDRRQDMRRQGSNRMVGRHRLSWRNLTALVDVDT